MDTDMQPFLQINGLIKSYRSHFWVPKFVALKGIDLHIDSGDIYGFLGPNGAGKTTTIKCIIGLIRPEAGSILMKGEPLSFPNDLQKIGFLPENPYLYEYLTAEEFMTLTGRLFSIPMDQIKEKTQILLKLVGLSGKEKIKLRKFSKGMMQRIGLAQALINDPSFLILDEPFSGLDPMGRKELRDIILDQKEKGKTIFFSSHILQDVEMIADKVGIIVNGYTLREGKLPDLISQSIQYFEIVCSNISEKIIQSIHPYHFVKHNQFSLRVEEENRINDIVESIIHNGGKIISVTPYKMSLEDIFIKELSEIK